MWAQPELVFILLLLLLLLLLRSRRLLPWHYHLRRRYLLSLNPLGS